MSVIGWDRAGPRFGLLWQTHRDAVAGDPAIY
jgi:hypothetical protein